MVVSLVIAAVFGLQEPPALPGPPECLDDNHTNRCLPEVQAGVRERLGLASIEAEAESGAEVYRAMFVDGHGGDMPAVAFERRAGRSPEVVVHAANGVRLRAPVSGETWRRVQTESRFADRRLEPLASSVGGQVEPLCLHSWVQTVEMANSPISRWERAPVRRRTENACGGALTNRFAFLLAEEAVKAIHLAMNWIPRTCA